MSIIGPRPVTAMNRECGGKAS